MGINILPAPATGDPAAQQVIFTSTSAVSLTTALPVGIYELTTDTVQTGTFTFTVGSDTYASFVRGGKSFIDLRTAGAGATSITPPSGGTFPFMLNIRAASINSAGAVYAAVPIDYLVIAGGGGASASGFEYPSNGGGGAGGYLTGSTTIYRGFTATVTVGAGGTGGTFANSNTVTNGSDSVLTATAVGLSVTTTGGGKGQIGYGSAGGRTSLAGGSGGGGSGGGSGGNGVAGQGFRGGDNLSSYGGSGGGGASAQGVDYPAGQPNNGQATKGGDGLSSSITGSAVTRAGGGGGGWSPYYGTPVQADNAGGAGGGGQGGSGTDNTGNNLRSYAPGSGTANTGSGGGGAGASNGSNNYYRISGGSGGSGVVIIRYPDSFPAATATTGSPTVTNPTGYRVYTFTGSGSITF